MKRSERGHADSMTVARAVIALCVLASASASRTAHAGDCIDPSASASQTETTDTAMTMCFDPGGCWAFAIAARTWAPHAPLGAAASTPRAADPKPTANIRVCAPDGTDCHAFDLPGAQTFYNLQAIQTPDRARVAILGQGSSAYLYDGATRKLVATIAPWKSHYEADVIQEGHFIDGNLALYESSSPITDEVRLFDGATGKLIAPIDNSIMGDPIELAGGDWAFWHLETSTLVVVNAKTGKLGKRISLVGPGVKDITGGSLVTYRTTDKKLFLAARGDAASGIVVYDLASKKQTRSLPPMCKK
jgi:hypothetical protein